MIFEEKYLSCYNKINICLLLFFQLTRFHCLVAFTLCIAIVCYPNCDVTNFKVYLANKAGFLRDQKVKTKI